MIGKKTLTIFGVCCVVFLLTASLMTVMAGSALTDMEQLESILCILSWARCWLDRSFIGYQCIWIGG